jgi:hypothetical protein
VHADGGGTIAVAIAADASWIVIPRADAETPARIPIRIDPEKLAAGAHQGHVTFTAEGGSVARLTVSAQVGDLPTLLVRGEGCAMTDGKLRARAGAGCALVAADGDAAGIRWTLPGGAQASGGRMYGQFVRRGEFQVLVSSEEGTTEALPVIIE